MKHTVYKLSSTLLLLFLVFSCHNKDRVYTVSSPDGRNELEFSLTDLGQPQYRLNHNTKAVILPSLMGFEFVEQARLHENFEVLEVLYSQLDTTWQQPWGEFKTVSNSYNELTVKLQEQTDSARVLHVVFRVFNDGLGFRYEFPEQPNLKTFKIANELTQFTFPQDHDVWWIPVHSENSFYESFYRKNKISETDTLNTPATFQTKDSLYVALHEANLTDYASMTLLHKEGHQYEADLVPWADGVKVYAQAPFKTPWRTLIVGDTPGDLVTSTLMLNLNEPNKIKDVSWIEPSKYIGIWWGMHIEKYTWGQGDRHGATTENTKSYIDFAAAHNFDGVLVEGWNYGWDGDWTADGTAFSFTEAYPDFDLEEVTKYAAMKNVRLIGHHETAGASQHYEKQLDSAFKLYHRLGVNAVKTGYVNKYLDKKEWHDGQYGVRHYRKVIETAAQYNIMIDNHEPVKGTGLQRTYPNLMTQEGARGQEYNAWSADGGNTPEHTTIMPFTRMLSGPFDFTPGNFDFDYKTPNGAMVQTTLAKQLALYVVLFSPLQMASDLPENYLKHPDAFQFVKEVPAIWSTTEVLDSRIGEYVVMARKDWQETHWYLGAITNSSSRQLAVSLSFLDANKRYKATVYADGAEAHYKSNPYPVEISSIEVTRESVLDLQLAAGGGTAVKFSPID